MADLTSTRRGLLGAMAVVPAAAAVTILPVQAATSDLWQRRYDEFRRLKALLDAAGNCGDCYEAGERCSYAQLGLNRDGSKFAGDLQRYKEAEWDRLGAVEKQHMADYIDPVDVAIEVLIRTPAPTLDAAILKVELIKDFEVRAWREFASGELMAIVTADLRRLAA